MLEGPAIPAILRDHEGPAIPHAAGGDGGGGGGGPVLTGDWVRAAVGAGFGWGYKGS